MTTYKCWHGDTNERCNEAEIEAFMPDEAAREFALRFEDGEVCDDVYVLVGDRVHEYRCRFGRSVTCDARLVGTYEAAQ